jgi:beta-aspartyl-peptidase (threonine type)
MLLETTALDDAFASDVRALCLTPDGRHGAAAWRGGATYSVLTADRDEVELLGAVVA